MILVYRFVPMVLFTGLSPWYDLQVLSPCTLCTIYMFVADGTIYSVSLWYYLDMYSLSG